MATGDVQKLYDAMAKQAADLYSETRGQLTELKNMAAATTKIQWPVLREWEGERASLYEPPDIAELKRADVNIAGFSDELLQDVTIKTDYDFPTISAFTKTAPALDFGSMPAPFTESAPTGQPNINTIVPPTRPDLPTYTEPTLIEPTIEDKPPITWPDEYAEALPAEADITIPSNTFNFNEDRYSSALLTALKAKVTEGIAGASGVDPAAAAAVWDRDIERRAIATRDSIAIARETFAKRGFDLPPGKSDKKVQEILLNFANERSNQSRDAAIKEYDAIFQNMQFMTQQGISIEQTLITYTAGVYERMLTASKTMLESAIAVCNAQIAAGNYKLNRYKTGAEVNTEKIRSIEQKIASWRADIEAARAKGEFNSQKVEIWSKKISVGTQLLERYRIEAEVAQILGNLERQKIELYQLTVSIYETKLKAKVAEYNMGEARIRGEVAKVQAFEAEVHAYTSEVSAKEAAARIILGKIDAETKILQQKGDLYRLKLEKRRSQIEEIRLEQDINDKEFEASARKFHEYVGHNDATSRNALAYAKERAIGIEHQNQQAIGIAIQQAAETMAGLQRMQSIVESIAKTYGDLFKSMQTASGLAVVKG